MNPKTIKTLNETHFNSSLFCSDKKLKRETILKVLQLLLIINFKHAIECSIANNSCLHHIMDGLTIIDKTFGLIILFKMLIALQQLD